MLGDRRGQIRVLEALLATAVVFSALLLTRPVYVALDDVDDPGVLYSVGVNVLVGLDRDGELGRLVAEGNWGTLSERLSTLLPVGVSFNLTVYNEDMETVNDSPVSSGDVSGRRVVSVQYVLAERTSFQFYVVRLQLAWMR